MQSHSLITWNTILRICVNVKIICYNNGVYYLLGKGVPENPVKALKWFKLAVDLGEPGAEEMVAEAQSRI